MKSIAASVVASQFSQNRTLERVLLCIASAALLSIYGCGGGGGGGGGGGSTVIQPSPTPTTSFKGGDGGGSTVVEPSPTPTITFKGVVATGAPARGAEVRIEGCDTTAITDDDGNYSLTIPCSLKPPYIFNASFFQSGVPKKLKSIVMEEGGGLKKIANITPITDTITSALVDYHNREGNRELPVNLGLFKTVKEVFKGVMRDAGCGSICAEESYDLISTEFGPEVPHVYRIPTQLG